MVFLPIYIVAIFSMAFSKVRWAPLAVAILLCLLTSTTTDYADLSAYVSYYEIVQSGFTPSGAMELPIGWLAICKGFASLGLTARGMICAVLCISIGLTSIFFKKIGCKSNLVWALFLIFPALVQCAQLRYFLSFSIVLVSFIGLINKNKIGFIFFLTGILIASLIHTSALVFLVLAPSGFLGSLSKRKATIVIVAFALAAYCIIGYVPNIASGLLNSVKYERYFNSDISVTTLSWFTKIASIWAAVLAIAFVSVRTLSNHNGYKNQIVTLDKKRNSTLFAGIALLGLTLPLLQFDSNFHRFIEMGYMFSYAILTFVWQSPAITPSHKFALLLCLLAIGVGAAYVYIPLDTVVEPLLSFDGFQPLLV